MDEAKNDRAQLLALSLCELRLDCAGDALMAAADQIEALGGDAAAARAAGRDAYAALRRQPGGLPQFYLDLTAEPVTVSEPETGPETIAEAPDTVAG